MDVLRDVKMSVESLILSYIDFINAINTLRSSSIRSVLVRPEESKVVAEKTVDLDKVTEVLRDFAKQHPAEPLNSSDVDAVLQQVVLFELKSHLKFNYWGNKFPTTLVISTPEM